MKIANKGQIQIKALSVINAYPHVAGNNFPAITNALGGLSPGDMLPESIVEERDYRIEDIDVFAISFTANPITLAILSDTAVLLWKLRVLKSGPGWLCIRDHFSSGGAVRRLSSF